MALHRLERTREVFTVNMNDVQFCDFRRTVKAIGTRDLKGCHVVIVASKYGAVFGHISPRSGRQAPDDPSGGEAHITGQMQRVVAMYEDYKAQNFFPQSDSGTHTIHAVLNGEVALPDQKALIESHLLHVGLPRPSSFMYNVDILANADTDSSKGTVLLLGHSTPPMLLVEDIVVFPQAHFDSTTQTSESVQARVLSPAANSSTPDNFTGWTCSDQTYIAYHDGTVVGRVSSPPCKQWIFNKSGWTTAGKMWMWWDGKVAQYR